jgi:hypothetical protein
LKFGDFDEGYLVARDVGGSSLAVLGIRGLWWPTVDEGEGEGRGKREERDLSKNVGGECFLIGEREFSRVKKKKKKKKKTKKQCFFRN